MSDATTRVADATGNWVDTRAPLWLPGVGGRGADWALARKAAAERKTSAKLASQPKRRTQISGM